MSNTNKVPLRSKLWFDNPENPGMTALYLERYLKQFEMVVAIVISAVKNPKKSNESETAPGQT